MLQVIPAHTNNYTMALYITDDAERFLLQNYFIQIFSEKFVISHRTILGQFR